MQRDREYLLDIIEACRLADLISLSLPSQSKEQPEEKAVVTAALRLLLCKQSRYNINLQISF
jgi:hypothetical protein